MTQPEALRLADALTCPTYPDWVMHIPAPWHPPAQEVRKAAAELRRLHAENEALQNTKHYEAQPGFVLNPDYLVPELRAQRDALLEALKYHQEQTRPIQGTLDVIKAVEEGK